MLHQPTNTHTETLFHRGTLYGAVTRGPFVKIHHRDVKQDAVLSDIVVVKHPGFGFRVVASEDHRVHVEGFFELVVEYP